MGHKIRVMFVDDEANILSMIRRVLRHEPWEIEYYNNPQEAWQAIQKKPVDILVSDHRMEGMNGVELLARVKATYPETLRIIFSGYSEVSTLTEAINKGHIYKFIHKPIKEDELRLTLRRAAENVMLMRENQALAEKIKAQNEELRQLNEELEARIEQRTRDLYLRQKALETAQAILDSLPAAVLGIGMDGLIVYCNTAVSQLFDVQQGELLGQSYDEVLPRVFVEFVQKVMKDGNSKTWQGRLFDQPLFAQFNTFSSESSNTGGIVLSVICYPESDTATVMDEGESGPKNNMRQCR